MNKKVLVPIAIVLVAVLGAGVFFFISTRDSKPSKEALIAHGVSLTAEDNEGYEEETRQWFTCLIDGIYDDLPADYFNAILEQDIDSEEFVELEAIYLNEEQQDLFYDVSDKCSEKLMGTSGSAMFSSAETTMRNAITAVKATQTGLGVTDYASINQNILANNEPDINWVSSNLTEESDDNTVALIELTATKIVLQTTDGSTCYFTEINADGPTRYGTSGMNNGNCPSDAGANGGNAYADVSSEGWS